MSRTLESVMDLITIGRIVTSGQLADEWSCESVLPECSREAVYRVKWGPDLRMPPVFQCGCRRTSLICLPCFERKTALALQDDAAVTCIVCDRAMVIVSSEPVRRRS